MKQYDLQVHTDASPCSRASPADVVDAAIDAGLEGIAITNHDTLAGYDEVADLAPADLNVIPGVEVTTTQGHLLALYVNDEPPQTDPVTVIEHVHEQDGIAILSHPFDRFREYYDTDLDAIASRVDAVEVQNSRCLLSRFNRHAREFATQHDLAITGGSDAHFPMEVGRSTTVCEPPLREAIESTATQTAGRGGYLSGHTATKLNDALRMVNL
ncbi:PHP domain-containing protein [Halobaculum sp. CBA1158]|uniref:PHP domain-containing protein n=1 Tax=Halobaculum sp. CBA1158 TaxID=2904243 RepID=UPI001F42715E|nr:PHP domain-containing protein [Halobaculum sp. CBA1158]UIP00990.1 PHP domain-containing protein [Halobaculum sp. CBA1158]